MAKFKMIVLTSPVPGEEEAFHHWYQNIHLPELLETAGMLGAQRYQRVATLRGADDNGWLAIYDIECDDPQEFLSAMKAASAAGKRTGSDAVDLRPPIMRYLPNTATGFCRSNSGPAGPPAP